MPLPSLIRRILIRVFDLVLHFVRWAGSGFGRYRHAAFLEGNFSPVTEQLTCVDLHVVGSLPPDLNGAFVRNGPNQRQTTSGNYHWCGAAGGSAATRLIAACARARCWGSTGLMAMECCMQCAFMAEGPRTSTAGSKPHACGCRTLTRGRPC